ncbi:hypothetical protein AALP_AA2G069800 [Arabis alpina]|uniref:Uncharacterized protein n=1 Tax=Arabis alpina TaxID=50452 RepID=A0A087HFT0_ARAAL|nr:hypothetical protein AALP_AA2G069800 [Arabis alpina]
MAMNLSNVKLTFVEDEASKKASDERKMAKILKNFDAFAPIFNPSTEDVEDLKQKFIASSLKDSAKKEEDQWALLHNRIDKSQALLMKLQENHPDTIHDCMFGCNKMIESYLDGLNIGDLCFLVNKSLVEFINRINYHREKGEFAYFSPHYDAREVSADMDSDADVNANADTDAGAGARRGAEYVPQMEQSALKLYEMLYKRLTNKYLFVNHVDMNETPKMENEDIPSLEDNDHQASTSGLATTDDVPSVTTDAADDGTR